MGYGKPFPELGDSYPNPGFLLSLTCRKTRYIIAVMKAEIIAIGTELLLGRIVNTNTAYLGRKLAELGIDLYYQTTVGDNPERLIELVKRALGRSDIAILTGGLGPTVDDITVEAVKAIAGRRAIKWIANKVGTAPGLIIEETGKAIICLPGPPREMEPMFEKEIVPYLKKRFGLSSILKTRVIRTTGLAEIRVNGIVKGLLTLKPPTTVGIYARLGEVDLVIMSKAKNDREAAKAIGPIEKKIQSRLKDYIFGFDGETLESAVGNALRKKKKTLAIAESCTGGLISNRITDVSGSSDYFLAGLVTYSNRSKENLLAVSKSALQRYGAVSRQVAARMASGAKRLIGADIGLAVTGIAGPKGGTKAKPVGLVFIAFVDGKKKIVKSFRFKGSRQDIKFQSSQAALDIIRRNV